MLGTSSWCDMAPSPQVNQPKRSPKQTTSLFIQSLNSPGDPARLMERQSNLLHFFVCFNTQKHKELPLRALPGSHLSSSSIVHPCKSMYSPLSYWQRTCAHQPSAPGTRMRRSSRSRCVHQSHPGCACCDPSADPLLCHQPLAPASIRQEGANKSVIPGLSICSPALYNSSRHC